MSKIVSFLVALAVTYNLSVGITYGETINSEGKTRTESSTELDIKSLLENIDDLDIDSLHEDSKQAVINKLVLSYFQEDLTVELPEVDAGLTPNDFFYFLDKLEENIRVNLASNEEEKARILIEIALERLAEFNLLKLEDKLKYFENIIDSYIGTLGQATQAIEQVQEENPEAEVAEIISAMEEVIQVGDGILGSEELPDEVVEEASGKLEKVEEVIVKAKSVAGIDTEVVTKLREQGLGYGEIKLVSKIASVSEKTIDEVMTIYVENKGIGATMKAMGISPSKLNGKANKVKVDEEREVIEEEVEKENDEVIGEAEEIIEVISSTEGADDEVEDKENQEIQVKQQEVKINGVENQVEAEKKVAEKQVEAQKKTIEKQAEVKKRATEKQNEASKKSGEAKDNKNKNSKQ